MTPLQLREAARLLHLGGIVAYPTEAVFGLGCDPLNEQSVHRLLAIKQRAMNKGLILIGADLAHVQPYMQPVDETHMRRVLDSWPGAATWLLPAAERVPRWLTGQHERIALRLTAHPLAAALCRAFGGAIISTSANMSKRPPARNSLQARIRCANQADMILSGATGQLGSPTPIRDALTGHSIRG
jgi:L-threonylcarbamoyladenylate synthase